MAKLTRTESKERRALAKMVVTILKTSARPHKCRVARNRLFKDYNGWFVEVQANISPRHFRTSAATRIKPMELDPIFCDIVGLPENVRLPLSFRAFGAWVCAAPAISADGRWVVFTSSTSFGPGLPRVFLADRCVSSSDPVYVGCEPFLYRISTSVAEAFA